MDNRGIRKRKDTKNNEIKLQSEDIFIKESTRNTSWSNSFAKIEGEQNFNNNSTTHSIRSNSRRNYSCESRKSEKKKSLGIFHTSNISSLSNNCVKSFNNILNNLNYSMKSTNNNNNNYGSNISNNMFNANQIKNINYPTNINKFSNINNTHDKINLENNTENSDFNFYNNSDNYSSTKNNKRSNKYYNNGNINIDFNNGLNNNSKKENNEKKYDDVVNSKNLENFLNNKEILNKNYEITGFGNSYTNEINNLKNITNDQTYFTCLDNLLRNHGNIDSNEMLKYNDKNINCLNDIIFLDIYRAYNVLTYMQDKINIIVLTIKFIGKKLKRKHVPEEVVISLEFLNFCVKNLGLFFVRFIDENFMKKLGKLLRTTTLKKSITKNVKSKLSKFLIVPIIHPGVATDPRLHFIKRKILFMLQLWHDSFILHQHMVSAVFAEYKSLKEKGVTFPIINKSEKFFVKNAETSPSFSDDNILHDLPLNLVQINNIMRSLKEIQNMYHDEERTKCIFVLSKFKEQIVQCINRLSDYKGNANVSVTLNSLLYINDQIGILNKLEKERKEKDEKEHEQAKEREKEQEHKVEKEREKKKKKEKKKNRDNSELNNINEIIFNKYDPWNNEKVDTNNEGYNTDKTFFKESLGNFANISNEEPMEVLFNNKKENLFNNENMFSFFKEDEKKERNTDNENNDINDKYSIFNELNFDNDKENICISENTELYNIKEKGDNQVFDAGNNLYHLHIENEKKYEVTSNNKSIVNNQEYKENGSKLYEENTNDFDINEINNFNSTNHIPIHNEEILNIPTLKECSNTSVNHLNNLSKDKGNLDIGMINSDCKRIEMEEINYNLYHSTNKNNYNIKIADYDVPNSEENNFNLEKNFSFNNCNGVDSGIEDKISGKNNYDDNAKTEKIYMDISCTNKEKPSKEEIKEIVSDHVSLYNKDKSDIIDHLTNKDDSNSGVNTLYNSDKQNEKKIVEKKIYEDEKHKRDNINENNYDLFETFDFNTTNNNCDKENINQNKNSNLENTNEKQFDIFLSNGCENKDENSIHSTKENDNTELCKQKENSLHDNFIEQNDKQNISMNVGIKKIHYMEKSENKNIVLDTHNTNSQEIEKELISVENLDKNCVFSIEETNNRIVNENMVPINMNVQSENDSVNVLEMDMNGVNNEDNYSCDEEKYDTKYNNNLSEFEGELNSENVELKKNYNNDNNLEKCSTIKDQNSFNKKSDDISNADSNDINFDEIDEITKALDDINDNFENMNIYKFDH